MLILRDLTTQLRWTELDHSLTAEKNYLDFERNPGRTNATLTALATGKALVAGGSTDPGNTTLASAELYDRVTGTWSSTGSMATARAQHTATLLQNGRVLVAGGTDSTLVPLDSAELYDPVTGTWSTTAAMFAARRLHTATMLLDGRVLVVAGLGDLDSQNPVLSRAEAYDLATGKWSHAGKLHDERWGHMAALLGTGQVLVAGGSSKSGAILASAELFQP